MTARTPGRAIPRAELTDTEAARLIGAAAQAYDYENRPRDRNWTAVPLDQVIRLVTGALGAMEFDDDAQQPASVVTGYESAGGAVGQLEDRLAEVGDAADDYRAALTAMQAERDRARATLDRVLEWFAGSGGTIREAAVTRAQLANAYRDGGLPVPSELVRFL